jgi:Stage II sporulation protein E (SpoIIE)
MSDAAREMLAGLMSAVRLNVPDDVAALVADRGTALGADNVTIYLADQEQYQLVPVPTTSGGSREPLGIEATLAGRCFRQLELQDVNGGREVWLPLLDGLERLGVVQLEFAHPGARVDDELLHAFAALIAEIVLVKDAYGDLFTIVRRREPMSLAGEITWNLMPPMTFGTERVVISCVLAPAYDVGGDSFDYAVDDVTARMAIFDAMGHGLNAGLLATVAIAAYRRARRTGRTLTETVTSLDAAVADAFAGEQFVTALIAELDLTSGRLAWHSAGHPAPLLLRGNRVVKTLDSEPGLPLGLAAALCDIPAVEAESLEPGDRLLLYSDGVVEARDADGTFFGTERLADLVGRETAAGRPAPETMRRLMHAILDHQVGALQDDATTMLVEWRTGGAQRITPEPDAGATRVARQAARAPSL